MNSVIILQSGKLVWRGKEYQCALGKSGTREDKTEGDKATPAGCFFLRKVFFRPDRIKNLKTDLPVKALARDDGWCDDPKDKNYNKLVKLPYPASAEILWRKDNLYDVLAIMGYNDKPPVSGKGSAIFIHIARKKYSPTSGCIALALPDLLEILKTLKKETPICINANQKRSSDLT